FAGTTVSNKIHLYYDAATGQYALERNLTMQNRVDHTVAAVAGRADTVIAAWTPWQIMISVNGRPFATASSSEVPNLLLGNFSLGNFNGEMLWAAFGSGTLSPADVSRLTTLGDTDPTTAVLLP